MKDYVVDNDIDIMALAETWLLEIPMMLKWELCVLPAIGSYIFQDLIPGEEELVCYLKTILISTPYLCVTPFSHLNSWMSVSEAFSVLGSWLFNVHPTTTPVCFSLKSSLDYRANCC